MNMMFTACYAAPEVVEGVMQTREGRVKISALSQDIWSLGCVAAMLYTGMNFFDGDVQHASSAHQAWVSRTHCLLHIRRGPNFF